MGDAKTHVFEINVHDKDAVMALFKDHVDIKVSNVPLTLAMSSVAGLADLVEDEIIPKPIPMEVSHIIFKTIFVIFLFENILQILFNLL